MTAGGESAIVTRRVVNVGTSSPSWHRSSDDHIQYYLLLIRVQRDIVKWRQRLSISLDEGTELDNISDAIAAGCQGLRRSRYPFVGRGD
jgi:hypothetical protein